MTAHDEDAYLEEADEWDWDAAEIHEPVGDAGAVMAIRFSGENFEVVAEAAERLGVPLTAFIHDAALKRATQQLVKPQAPDGGARAKHA